MSYIYICLTHFVILIFIVLSSGNYALFDARGRDLHPHPWSGRRPVVTPQNLADDTLLRRDWKQQLVWPDQLNLIIIHFIF